MQMLTIFLVPLWHDCFPCEITLPNRAAEHPANAQYIPEAPTVGTVTVWNRFVLAWPVRLAVLPTARQLLTVCRRICGMHELSGWNQHMPSHDDEQPSIETKRYYIYTIIITAGHRFPHHPHPQATWVQSTHDPWLSWYAVGWPRTPS